MPISATTIKRCIVTIAAMLVGLCVIAPLSAAPTVDDLWNGKAHFEQVGELNWSAAPGQRDESAGWFTVRDGVWYAFNRAYINAKVDYCSLDHTRVVVRESRDDGKSWSKPVVAIEPGDSRMGDECSALDGSSYYDAPTGTWHILAQCLTRDERSAWAMCHYSRKAASPVGRFTADPANPVVRGGALWSQICAGTGKACPATTQDEGTPEIIEKRDGRFIVTMHGYDPVSRFGFRGVVATKDFRTWSTSGVGLPGDAMFGPKDCQSWLKGCIGTGAVTTLLTKNYAYLVGEVMDKGLGCQTDQRWIFEIFRIPRGPWPRSGSGQWQKLPGPPLLAPSWPDPATLCQVAYARWVVDGADIYLIYEDWGQQRKFVDRRLLKLVSGGGQRVQLKPLTARP
ncbi:MAG: sialidase family protein [bacterium]|nr:sialidase family protein [bacterium]